MALKLSENSLAYLKSRSPIARYILEKSPLRFSCRSVRAKSPLSRIESAVEESGLRNFAVDDRRRRRGVVSPVRDDRSHYARLRQTGVTATPDNAGAAISRRASFSPGRRSIGQYY